MKDTTFKEAYKLAFTPSKELFKMMRSSDEKALREGIKLIFAGLTIATDMLPERCLGLTLHKAITFFCSMTSHIEDDGT